MDKVLSEYGINNIDVLITEGTMLSRIDEVKVSEFSNYKDRIKIFNDGEVISIKSPYNDCIINL